MVCDGEERYERSSWVELTGGKEFSRVLYTNPVCFLYTEKDARKEQSARVDDTNQQPTYGIPSARNVQVISWLTATNNEGAFVFSINQRRYTASILQQDTSTTSQAQGGADINTSSSTNKTNEAKQYFTLSVPVHGMEELVRNVGSSSGLYGSKFAQDYDQTNHTKEVEHGQEKYTTSNTSSTTDSTSGESPRLSKRQRKKLQRHQPRFPTGIPGLRRVPLGGLQSSTPSSQEQSTKESKNLVDQDVRHVSCIQGTVAHLLCFVTQSLSTSSPPLSSSCPGNDAGDPRTLQEPHFIMFAQVQSAFVRADYWDCQKKLFRPSNSKLPPYLTFFGSQTFGYVHTEPFPSIKTDSEKDREDNS